MLVIMTLKKLHRFVDIPRNFLYFIEHGPISRAPVVGIFRKLAGGSVF